MSNEAYISQKFGRLRVIAIEEGKESRAIAVCKCDCGTRKKVKLSNLKSGGTQSCGCLLKECREKQKRIFKTGYKHTDKTDNSKPNVKLDWKV